VTDKEGATVAMTKILSDYYQSDESWWEHAYNNGQGDVFIDDRGFDDSVGALVAGIVVPVYDNGHVIGILKINYKISEILDVVTRSDQNNRESALLARSQGNVLVHSDGSGEHKLSDEEKRILVGNIGSGSAESSHGAEKMILGFAQVTTDIFTRVPNAGEQKGISGEKWEPTNWFLFIEMDQTEAFASVASLKHIFIVTGIITILLALIAAIVSALSISRPILRLAEVARDISKGKFGTEMEGLHRKDEIGELANAFSRTVTSLKLAMRNERTQNDKFKIKNDENNGTKE